VFYCEDDLLINLVVCTPKLARRKFRQHIFEAWNWKCAYCGKSLEEHTATIDHILPKHKGGQNIRSNMAAACSACNRAKGSFLLPDWFNESLNFFCEKRLDKLNKWVRQESFSIKLQSTGPLAASNTNEPHVTRYYV